MNNDCHIDLSDIYTRFSEQEVIDEVRHTLGKGIHEVIKEAHHRERDPFVFSAALLNILKDDNQSIYLSALDHVSEILTALTSNLDSDFETLGLNHDTFVEEDINRGYPEDLAVIALKYNALEEIVLRIADILKLLTK